MLGNRRGCSRRPLTLIRNQLWKGDFGCETATPMPKLPHPTDSSNTLQIHLSLSKKCHPERSPKGVVEGSAVSWGTPPSSWKASVWKASLWQASVHASKAIEPFSRPRLRLRYGFDCQVPVGPPSTGNPHESNGLAPKNKSSQGAFSPQRLRYTGYRKTRI